MVPAVERKWQMIRVRSGDYLLPSNDRQTVFRIYRYTDGPSSGLDVDWKDRDFWAVWRWLKGGPETLDFEDTFPSGWIEVASFLDTRKVAIDVALRWEADHA